MTKSASRVGFIRQLAVGLVVIYLAVGLFAAACPAASDPTAAAHGHQHGGTEHGAAAHSLLCAWSCQVSPLLGLTTSAPVSGPILVVLGFLITVRTAIRTAISGPVAARAPPIGS